jgi:hypothetical protein
VPELTTAISTGVPSCLGAAFDATGRLAITYAFNGNPTVLYDWNADLDFGDAGENITPIGLGFTSGCDVTRSATSGRLVFAYNRNAELRIVADTNDDGDLADAAENTLLSTFSSGPFSITTNASGAVRILARQGVFLGPVR